MTFLFKPSLAIAGLSMVVPQPTCNHYQDHHMFDSIVGDPLFRGVKTFIIIQVLGGFIKYIITYFI